MTRPRPRPTTPPLAVTLRAALAQGWHTLDALEALAGRATGARLRVHAALGELRAEGCALEERVERGVAEVRLGAATLPDHPTLREPSPPVEGEPVDAASYYLGRGRGEEEDADIDAVRAARGRDLRERVIASLPPGATAREIMFAEAAEIVRMRGPAEPATALDAPASPCEPSAPVEAADAPASRDRCARRGVPSGNHAPHDGHAFSSRAPVDPLFVECRVCNADPGHPCKGVEGQAFDGSLHVVRAADAEAWARVQDGLPSAPAEATEGPDAPAQRVSVVAAHLAHYGHVEEAREVEGLPAAAPPKDPGPGSRCARPGCGKRFDQHGAPRGTVCPFAPKPRGRPRVAPASQRLAAVQADDPDVTELPTVAEQAAILAGARAAHEAAVEEARVERAEPETTRGEAPGDQANGKRNESEATDVGTTDDGAEGERAATHPASGGSPAQGSGKRAVRAGVPREGEGAGGRAPRRGGKADEPVRLTRPPRCPSVWHDVQCEREAGHPCGSEDEPGRHHETADRDTIWTDEAAARWAQRRAEEARETARGGSRARRAPAAAPVVAPPCRPPLCHADDIHEPSRVRSFQRPLCERHRRWVEEAGGTLAAGGLAGEMPPASPPL